VLGKPSKNRIHLSNLALASYFGNILRRHKSSEDLLRYRPAEVEERMAFATETHLLDQTAHARVLADVVFGFLWQDWHRCSACQHGEKE
jgi:hypothetical protein